MTSARPSVAKWFRVRDRKRSSLVWNPPSATGSESCRVPENSSPWKLGCSWNTKGSSRTTKVSSIVGRTGSALAAAARVGIKGSIWGSRSITEVAVLRGSGCVLAPAMMDDREAEVLDSVSASGRCNATKPWPSASSEICNSRPVCKKASSNSRAVCESATSRISSPCAGSYSLSNRGRSMSGPTAVSEPATWSTSVSVSGALAEAISGTRISKGKSRVTNSCSSSWRADGRWVGSFFRHAVTNSRNEGDPVASLTLGGGFCAMWCMALMGFLLDNGAFISAVGKRKERKNRPRDKFNASDSQRPNVRRGIVELFILRLDHFGRHPVWRADKGVGWAPLRG
eukprot:m.676396 g.676396  ORF g.676396 m.676396 type:complete len:341 (-) comp58558_c0_seq16:561-1583(-)